MEVIIFYTTGLTQHHEVPYFVFDSRPTTTDESLSNSTQMSKKVILNQYFNDTVYERRLNEPVPVKINCVVCLEKSRLTYK